MENNQRPGAVQLDDTRQFWLNWITNLQQTDAAGPEGYQYLADVLNGCEPLTIAAVNEAEEWARGLDVDGTFPTLALHFQNLADYLQTLLDKESA